MGHKLHNRIELWKKQLLDFGKRNRLINFLEGKRNNVTFTTPSFDTLWHHIVIDEREIVFPYAKKVRVDDDGEEIYETVIKGDVETNKSIGDLQKTLKTLRYRANTSIEEQGINTLYITFGMLKWKERDDSSQVLSSPVILVPVKLVIDSIISPYRLALLDDEIVINPTLSHKLDNDFGIIMPEFDSAQDTAAEYIERLQSLIENEDWNVDYSTHLTNLSFLKINMYKDLDGNEEKINANPVIAALVGEQDPIAVSEELNNYDHDKQIRPIDSFQVVDADSSQQDAILLSKKGVSFVLQGPPGTGKSQTITNIIAEAIADGKKVLFVSEKMAALQVVYNRLASVGLADFCFTLHSHKAKKKEILRDLANSINIERTRVRDEALSQLNLLEWKRDVLNEYQKELHTPTSGLNVSIFYVNGKLAKYVDVPDVVFSIPDIDSVTNRDLNEKIYLLDELSKTIGKRSEDYATNVWYDSSIEFLSNALRHEIDSNIAIAIPLIKKLEERQSAICSKLGIKLEASLHGVDDLISILSFGAKSPIFPFEWIDNRNIDALIDNARKYKVQVEHIVELTNALNNRYHKQFFDIDPEKYKERLSSLMCKLQAQLNQKASNCISQNIIDLAKKIKATTSSIDLLFEESGLIASELGMPIPHTIEQISVFAMVIRALASICAMHPTQKWFNSDELARIKSDIKINASVHHIVSESKKSILSCFDKEIFDWDYYPVLQRFRGDYKSFFKVFNGQYRKDIKQLNAFSSNGKKLSYNDAFDVLNTLKVISDNEAVIIANSQHYKDDYGSYYVGIDTQWDVLCNDITAFEQSVAYLHTVSSQLRDRILQGQLPISEIMQFNTDYSRINIENDFEQLVSIFQADFNKNTDWKEIRSYTETITIIGSEFLSEYNALLNMGKECYDYESIIYDLDLCISLDELNKELARQKDTICCLYKSYYKGIETDWDRLIEALKYAVDLKTLTDLYDFPDSFLKDICENSVIISYCDDESLKVRQLKQDLQGSIDWFVSLFKESKNFYDYNLLDLANRMILCRDNKHLLEEWVDYCANRKKCSDAGLGEFISKVEELDVDPNYIVDAYLKRFYHLWLDAILPKYPAIQTFRGRIQNQNINEFRNLDKGQFKIAQARVRERALSRIPDFNSINGPRDEIAILKRELNKQRRLMPLRKLFMAIPNLVTSLRPCFMMSPLSVSVYLEANSYDFDLVIFDEASQVHTEDAIGAIMRGRQVIIVGDTKQLPPTSFFSTSFNEEDFDVDSGELLEDSEAGAYESILDEAVAVLPERSLRWHYRSRHEHLIAFSNIKIYNSQLITFPSSTESAPDCGVEYVYVKDGIYDRGGKKSNIVEARKVADLVFEHFKKHPNRSLGVVTFSEAQQNAVDAAIRQKRLQNLGFDKFFIEDKEEAFFIKNLENVQGDERDTIIFSIGYAKDSKGIMHMNFGPLSREGGYRRLNVAITRAKYNVKLVGSIVPTDIDLEKVSSDGVKMLRSYIEFAQQGVSALERDITYNYNLDFDSPFEEAVYDFLQSKGYNVITQVGCSGFRIDMAVKHPTQNGKFVIGIECDGATYHSARTARERDRLRQTVLEDMGWTIYRIWSTDWIKNHKIEEEKLINAVEKALGREVLELEDCEALNEGNSEANPIIPVTDIEEKVEISKVGGNAYGFELYKRAYPLQLFNDNGHRKTEDIITDIITLEQPIHFEELCRRIAPAYYRQKATSVVRKQVKDIFNGHLKEVITEDENEFVRMKDFADIKVRVPNPDDDYLRPINYICDEELALAMKTIVRYSFGITSNDLFLVIARELGYKRTGENIINALRKIYCYMLENNELVEVNGKVRLASQS